MRAMRCLRFRIGLILALALPAAGCTAFTRPLVEGRSPLRRARMSPDACALEIFFVRFPLGDVEANDLLWREIDEQHFSTETRRQLARHGFRVGLVAGQIPVTLSQLLNIEDDAAPAGTASQVDLEELESGPKVVRRHLQLRPGGHSEIVASGIYDELTVLLCEPGGVCGRSYAKAQGMFTVRAVPQCDGRVTVDLVPELQYGEPGKRWIGAQGMWRLDTGRDKRVFENLTLAANLAAGEILVMTSLPQRLGSLGHYFFTDDKSGQPEQKLLLVRLAQTQHDGLFSESEPLPLDDLAE